MTYHPEGASADGRPELQAMLRPLRRRWKLLSVTIVLGSVATAALVLRMPQLYEASSTLALSGFPSAAGSANASTVRGLITTASALARAAGAAGHGSGSLRKDAVFVDPMPNTIFVRVRVRYDDPSAASRLADALAREAVQRSRQLRENGGESQIDGAPGLNEAKATLREAEQRVLDFRTRSRIELLAAEINAGLPRAGTIGPTRSRAAAGADSKVAGLLDELYRRELELARLQTDYKVARLKYLDVARTASNLAVPQIHMVETTVPPGQPVPMDRARMFLLGAAISILIGLVLAFAVEGIRPAISSRAPAR